MKKVGANGSSSSSPSCTRTPYNDKRHGRGRRKGEEEGGSDDKVMKRKRESHACVRSCTPPHPLR